MTEPEFYHNLAGAKTLMSISSPPDNDYWAGYIRGCNRNYQGDNFGTESDHIQWLSLTSKKFDEKRKYKGIGYRAGFDGLPISEAIKHLQKVIAKSNAGAALGSIKSEAKTAANRLNAAKPRPGAQGKPKPRKPKAD